MIVCRGAHETAIIFPTSIPLSNEHPTLRAAGKRSHRRETPNSADKQTRSLHARIMNL